MAKILYISSTTPKSGKTLLCIGLLLKLKKDGLKAGYFKPIGNPTLAVDGIDHDARTIANILEIEPKKNMSPVLLHPTMYYEEVTLLKYEKLIETIKNAYKQIAEGKDVVIIEGNNVFHHLRSFNLDDVSIAKELGAKIIIINALKDDRTMDYILTTAEYITLKSCQTLGVILNDIRKDMTARVKTHYTKKLEEMKIPLLGVFPEVPNLLAPTVEEVSETLECEVLEPGKKGAMDRLVENFIIGAMSMASALQYLQRAQPNSAVITGGDRADIAIAALEQDISVLIFTGNISPGIQIIEKAKVKGTPVLLSRFDTYKTTHHLENISANIQPKEAEYCLKSVEENLKIQAILN